MGRTVSRGQTTPNMVTGTSLNPTPPAQPNLQVADLEPGEYTLQFQVVNAPADGNGFAAQAIINWKVQGQQITRICSIYSGLAISGVAEAVDVKIQDTSVALGIVRVPPGVPAVNYSISATLSKGTRPTVQQPPTLQTTPPTVIAAAGGFIQVAVPQNVGAISVFVLVGNIQNAPANEFAPGDIEVRMTNGTQNYGFQPLQQQGWIPLPPGTTILTITNINASASATVTTLFGIEG